MLTIDSSKTISKEFESLLKKDSLVNRISKLINVSDEDIYKYASKLSELLTESFLSQCDDEELENGIDEELTYQLLQPLLKRNYELVNNIAYRSRKSLNKADNVGLNPVRAQFNDDRVHEVARQISLAKDTEDVISSQIKNIDLSFMDDFVEENAEADYSSGYELQVIRTCEPNACDWCQEKEGTYDYEEVKDSGDDVWKRHIGCLCTISIVRVKSPNSNSSFLRNRVRK